MFTQLTGVTNKNQLTGYINYIHMSPVIL